MDIRMGGEGVTMRVLIVDDEPLAQTALAEILSRRSDVEHFDSADDAIEALDKLAKSAYDILLLDINMPEVSGIELLDRLQDAKLAAFDAVYGESRPE